MYLYLFSLYLSFFFTDLEFKENIRRYSSVYYLPCLICEIMKISYQIQADTELQLPCLIAKCSLDGEKKCKKLHWKTL